jgi:hypothetical protein
MEMNRTGKWLARLLAAGLTVAAACNSVWAQAWQESTSASPSPSAEWQQRVLKRPQQQQWHAVGQSTSWSQDATRLPQTTEQYTQPSSPRQFTGNYQTARRLSAEREVAENIPTPRSPAVGGQRAPAAAGAEAIPPGQTQFEPLASDGAFAGSGCASCGGASCGGCGECGGCDPCCGPCGDNCDFGWEAFDGHCGKCLRGLSIFAGADAFRNAGFNTNNYSLPNTAEKANRGGAFGVNEGLNLARPLGDPWGCGYQIGANFVQSDFSGTSNAGNSNQTPFSPYRSQYFVTAGLFRRADVCGGFQGGIAYDYMHEVCDPYGSYDQMNLQQIRSETSYLFEDGYEIGFYGAYGVTTDWKSLTDISNVQLKLNPTNMYLLYLRSYFDNGGDGRIWGGATGNGDGLIGADVWLPLGGSFALQNRINYMIPKEGSGTTAQPRDSWGLVIQLVWYPGLNARCQRQNPYRPIFDVADNSLFMVDRLLSKP